MQDLLYVCPATPLQNAVMAAFNLGEEYYSNMRNMYLQKRDVTVAALKDCGFKVTAPQGAYYIMADFSELDFKNDDEAASFLLEEAKVATVTGRSFYQNPEDGKHLLRIWSVYMLLQKESSFTADLLRYFHLVVKTGFRELVNKFSIFYAMKVCI